MAKPMTEKACSGAARAASLILIATAIFLRLQDGNAAGLETVYGPKAAALIQRSSDIILNSAEAEGLSPNVYAQRCLAAVQLVPSFGKRAVESVRRNANALVATANDPVHGAGWTFIAEKKAEKACAGPGTFDAFGDGTCNPAGVRYTFQTGLALTCVAKAYTVTRDKAYLDTALSVVKSSWPHGGAPPSCDNCFYYWYSYHPNDADRFVRNTNTLMGMALSAVYEINHDQKIRNRLQQIANAEHHETAAGNFGYLGLADPKFRSKPDRERLRIDNHLPLVAQGSLVIGEIIGDKQSIADAKVAMNAWLDCPQGAACRNQPCERWAGDPSCTSTAAAAPCYFRSLDERFARACDAFLARVQRLSATQLWMVLSAVR